MSVLLTATELLKEWLEKHPDSSYDDLVISFKKKIREIEENPNGDK